MSTPADESARSSATVPSRTRPRSPARRSPDGGDPGAPLRSHHFETPAEIRAFAALGADLVGMSTVLEAAAAHAAGARVLGISLVSNLAAGVSPDPLSGEEVMVAARAAQPRLAALLGGVLDELGAAEEVRSGERDRAGGTPGSAAAP